jgi:hypothetical protein
METLLKNSLISKLSTMTNDRQKDYFCICDILLTKIHQSMTYYDKVSFNDSIIMYYVKKTDKIFGNVAVVSGPAHAGASRSANEIFTRDCQNFEATLKRMTKIWEEEQETNHKHEEEVNAMAQKKKLTKEIGRSTCQNTKGSKKPEIVSLAKAKKNTGPIKSPQKGVKFKELFSSTMPPGLGQKGGLLQAMEMEKLLQKQNSHEELRLDIDSDNDSLGPEHQANPDEDSNLKENTLLSAKGETVSAFDPKLHSHTTNSQTSSMTNIIFDVDHAGEPSPMHKFSQSVKNKTSSTHPWDNSASMTIYSPTSKGGELYGSNGNLTPDIDSSCEKGQHPDKPRLFSKSEKFLGCKDLEVSEGDEDDESSEKHSGNSKEDGEG